MATEQKILDMLNKYSKEFNLNIVDTYEDALSHPMMQALTHHLGDMNDLEKVSELLEFYTQDPDPIEEMEYDQLLSEDNNLTNILKTLTDELKESNEINRMRLEFEVIQFAASDDTINEFYKKFKKYMKNVGEKN